MNKLSTAFSRGFTVIELLVTLAVLSVVLMLAVPAFSRFTQKRAIELRSWEIRSALQLGRQLAVSQQQVWKVCTLDSGMQCTKENGVEIAVFRDDNNNHQLDAGEQLEKQLPLTDMQITLSASGRSYVRFKKNGESMESGNFEVCASDQRFEFGRRVIIFRSGRIRLSQDSNGDGLDEANGVTIRCHQS